MKDDSMLESSTITDEVLTAIRQITQAIDIHSRHLVKNHNITGPQLIILKVIEKNTTLSVSEAANQTNLSISTVTGILTRLEKRNFVKRTKSEQDKRKVIVALTAQGAAFLKQAPKPLQDRFISSFEKLENWERMMILSSLQRLVFFMKAEDIDVSPILATEPIAATVTDSGTKTGFNK